MSSARHIHRQPLWARWSPLLSVKKADEPAARVEAGELEFPDWSGMDDSVAPLDADAAFVLCEQYPVWFAEAAARWRKQRPEKCLVEFTL